MLVVPHLEVARHLRFDLGLDLAVSAHVLQVPVCVDDKHVEDYHTEESHDQFPPMVWRSENFLSMSDSFSNIELLKTLNRLDIRLGK